MSEADLRAEIDDLRSRLQATEAELENRQQFVAQVMEAEDRARRRIAQLIHDDALQSLLAANQDLMEAAPGREQVMRAHEVVSGTIAQLREAMLALHPVTLERGGLEQALVAVARQAERQCAGLSVSVEIDPAALGHNDELVLAILRELLSNVARHSRATTATVEVRRLSGSRRTAASFGSSPRQSQVPACGRASRISRQQARSRPTAAKGESRRDPEGRCRAEGRPGERRVGCPSQAGGSG